MHALNKHLAMAVLVASGCLVSLSGSIESVAGAAPRPCVAPIAATVHGKVLRSSAPVAVAGDCVPTHSRVGSGGPVARRALVRTASAYNGGAPPLTFHGGAVMGTAVPGEVTITPILWTPPGFTAPSSAYATLLRQFDADLAAGSGARTNVLSTLTEYTGAGGTALSYLVHASSPIVTTDLPATSGTISGENVAGCAADRGLVTGAEGDQYRYAGCVTDVQVMAEVEAVRAQRGLPDDAGHLYPVFLPKGLESCFTTKNGAHGGDCSLNASANPSQYCAYHSSVAQSGGAVYTVEPFPTRTTGSGGCDLGWVTTGATQSPNGNVAFDSAVNAYSHELSEAITDPFGGGWFDAKGNENGDECAYAVPSSLGGTAGASWDQTVNGHHYLLQAEFSNLAYGWNAQAGCLMAASVSAPTVTALSSTSAAVGDQLTVTGTALTGSPIVRIIGLIAPSSSATDTAVLVTVPPGATSGAVTVQTIAGTATAPGSLSIVIRTVPAFTSAPHVAASTTAPLSASLVVSGTPDPTITTASPLPTGVTLTDHGDGTATLLGTPAAGTAGVWPITLSAHNDAGTATQHLDLTVHDGAAITSSATAGFIAKVPGSFTITTVGAPLAVISVTGTLPKGMTFQPHADGTATLVGTIGAGKIASYPVTVDATNGVGVVDTEPLLIAVGTAPKLKAAATLTVARGASLSTTISGSGSPAPSISVVGAESWMHVQSVGPSSVQLSGIAPSGGIPRSISVTLQATSLLGTKIKTLVIHLR